MLTSKEQCIFRYSVVTCMNTKIGVGRQKIKPTDEIRTLMA